MRTQRLQRGASTADVMPRPAQLLTDWPQLILHTPYHKGSTSPEWETIGRRRAARLSAHDALRMPRAAWTVIGNTPKLIGQCVVARQPRAVLAAVDAFPDYAW